MVSRHDLNHDLVLTSLRLDLILASLDLSNYTVHYQSFMRHHQLYEMFTRNHDQLTKNGKHCYNDLFIWASQKALLRILLTNSEGSSSLSELFKSCNISITSGGQCRSECAFSHLISLLFCYALLIMLSSKMLLFSFFLQRFKLTSHYSVIHLFSNDSKAQKKSMQLYENCRSGPAWGM